MTDEMVVLQAGSYFVLCPECGHRNTMTEAAWHVQCGSCDAMIECPTTEHRFQEEAVLRPGVLCVNTYQWNCPDCARTNYVAQAHETVRCPVCGSEFAVAEVQHASAVQQMRLI
jgi:ribosomal protein S27E